MRPEVYCLCRSRSLVWGDGGMKGRPHADQDTKPGQYRAISEISMHDQFYARVGSACDPPCIFLFCFLLHQMLSWRNSFRSPNHVSTLCRYHLGISIALSASPYDAWFLRSYKELLSPPPPHTLSVLNCMHRGQCERKAGEFEQDLHPLSRSCDMGTGRAMLV